MIDYVHMGLDVAIDLKVLPRDKWKERIHQDGTIFYSARIRSVVFRYYPNRERLMISGKIIQLEYDTQVHNIDDIYGADIPQFIEDMNRHLEELLPGMPVDIRDFEVKRIDYCFNVYTDHVKEYLEFMSRAFKQANTGSRVDFTARHKLTGSVYVKTKSDYKNNARRRYVLNYYDKKDRLEYQRRHNHRIVREDWKWADGVLRLEIQCGFEFIKDLQKKFNIEKTFENLLSYKIALYAEEEIYKRVFSHKSSADFYTYEAAKQRLPRNAKARETLRDSSQGVKITGKKLAPRRKSIIDHGICPFAFLPKKGGIDMLENPIKLIRKKLAEIGIEI